MYIRGFGLEIFIGHLNHSRHRPLWFMLDGNDLEIYTLGLTIVISRSKRREVSRNEYVKNARNGVKVNQ